MHSDLDRGYREGSAAARKRLLPGLLALLAAAVFVADVALLRALYVPAVAYVIPILLAAYFLPSPRVVAGIAVWTIGLQVVSYVLEGDGLPLLPISYILGLSLMSALSVTLTDRVRREAELRQQANVQQSLFQAVVEHASAGIAFLRGPDFVFELVNPAYQAIVPGKKLVGRTVAETWPELADQVVPLLERVLETGEPFHAVDMPLPVRRGPDAPLEDLYFTFSYVPMQVPGRQGMGILVVVLETTDQVTARRQVEELVRQKDDFIQVAAHELKTPVAIMKGYAEAILRRTGEIPPERRKMLEAIDHGANRIDRIVDDLLDISKLHAGHLELARERIDLSQLVEQVADEMALTTRRHRLRVSSTEPVIVEGDRDRLEQVVITLIDNASRYSPGGGEVVVEVVRRGGEAVVSVQDQGVGIAREKQGGIFQRFYRAHTGTAYDYGGMGVGLYIAHEVVARHGGRMWFESEEWMGSTFYFSVPLRARDDRR